MDQVHEMEHQTQTVLEQEIFEEKRIPLTYAEFLNSFEDSTHAEWVNGEAIIFMPPTTRHQRIVNFLNMLIGLYLQVFKSGEVFIAPFAMRIQATGSVREPDLVFVNHENAHRIGELRLNGPADLIVEIISTASVSRDRGDKFYEYQAGGVREYWVIDPRPGVARADFWVLDDSGMYRPVPIGANGLYTSTVLPNFKLNVNALLAEELPNPLSALAEMIGMEALMQALQRDQ
jgi:Uma2 family endonuclease